jgi:hypothetical protein
MAIQDPSHPSPQSAEDLVGVLADPVRAVAAQARATLRCREVNQKDMIGLDRKT